MGGEKLLIVDDEAHLRETMRLALESDGYQIETAADGREGLSRFGTGGDWDLVLLDQRMPGLEGLEVLRILRERDPEARVLMVTAYGTIELAVDAMRAGAIDFLRKPFTPAVLRGAVRAALEQPRTRVHEEGPSLTKLGPRLPTPEPPLQRDLPHIHFRTLNGFKFWPVPIPEEDQETAALRVLRVFDVRAPAGVTRRCAVELTTSVRGLVREATGQDYPATHRLWDTVCKSALSAHLWEKAEMPPDNLLVYGLDREQLRMIRAMAGLGPDRTG